MLYVVVGYTGKLVHIRIDDPVAVSIHRLEIVQSAPVSHAAARAVFSARFARPLEI